MQRRPLLIGAASALAAFAAPALVRAQAVEKARLTASSTP